VARGRLADLAEGSGAPGLPGVAHVLAAQARRRDPLRPARARVQARDAAGSCSTPRRSRRDRARGWRWSSSGPRARAWWRCCCARTGSPPASSRTRARRPPSRGQVRRRRPPVPRVPAIAW
jgi:hypothetical protein